MAENVPRNKKSGKIAMMARFDYKQIRNQKTCEPRVFFSKKKQPANSTFVFKLQKKRRQVKQD